MPKLSILIPTLQSRKESFDSLCAFLLKQPLSSEVEILSDVDDGELSVGEKRNRLLQRATGDFVVFVDDDDKVSDTYVPDVVGVLRLDLDCVGFFGQVFFKGEFAGRMIHSVLCQSWTEEPGNYYRPPNHLNPIRRDIALTVPFQHIRFSEDHFWSLGLVESGLLKHEVFLGHKPMYFYKCGGEKKTL